MVLSPQVFVACRGGLCNVVVRGCEKNANVAAAHHLRHQIFTK